MSEIDEMWGIKEVAEYFKYSESHTRQRIVSQIGFPDSVSLVNGRTKEPPRWFAREVRAWARQRPRRAA